MNEQQNEQNIQYISYSLAFYGYIHSHANVGSGVEFVSLLFLHFVSVNGYHLSRKGCLLNFMTKGIRKSTKKTKLHLQTIFVWTNNFRIAYNCEDRRKYNIHSVLYVLIVISSVDTFFVQFFGTNIIHSIEIKD